MMRLFVVVPPYRDSTQMEYTGGIAANATVEAVVAPCTNGTLPATEPLPVTAPTEKPPPDAVALRALPLTSRQTLELMLKLAAVYQA